MTDPRGYDATTFSALVRDWAAMDLLKKLPPFDRKSGNLNVVIGTQQSEKAEVGRRTRQQKAETLKS